VKNTKILGPIRDQNGWRISTNGGLQVMCRKPNIVTTMKVRILEWADHVVSLYDNRTVKKVFVGKQGVRTKT
jgi:hypothetical protein